MFGSAQSTFLRGWNRNHAGWFSIYVDPIGPAVSATILLARHGHHAEVGHVLSGRSEIALDAAGTAEAERLAERLAAMPLTAIHASPRRRARDTAAIVAARHGLPVTVLRGLDEIDFGGWTGQSFAALADDPAWHVWNAARGTAATPAGETMAAATARAIAAITAATGRGPVLCVSHGDVIRGIVAHVLGVPADRIFAFDVDCASLTTLVVDGDAMRLIALNERPQ